MGRTWRKLSLGTLIRERLLIERYRRHRVEAALPYDWEAIRYDRRAVVNLLLAGRPDGRYLEIGCADNALFDAVMAARKVGVDPVRGGTHRMTSDAFFASYDGEPFDVVFIDGLHLYEQVRRDLDGALKILAGGGWIAFHDMLPRDWLEEHVPQIRTRGWTGDGWKVAFELLASPDIDFRMLTLDHGVVVARALRPDPLVPDLSADLRAARFGFLYDNVSRLPLADYHQALDWIMRSRTR